MFLATHHQHAFLVGLEHEVEILGDHLLANIEGLHKVHRVFLLVRCDEGEGDSLFASTTRSSR